MKRDPALRRALAAARVAAVGPCNTRCAGRGSCAFGRSGPDGGFCRERRPPRRGELPRTASDCEPRSTA